MKMCIRDRISSKLFADIAEYIDDHYVDVHTDSQRERLRRMSVLESRTLSADAAAAPMAVGGLDSLCLLYTSRCV